MTNDALRDRLGYAFRHPELLRRALTHRSFGAEFPLVLVDPVDGSLNAKQGVPVFGLMLSVLDGPLVSDALAGLVLNLNTGEEWKAVRAQGARRGGEPLTAMSRGYADRIQLLGLDLSIPSPSDPDRPVPGNAGEAHHWPARGRPVQGMRSVCRVGPMER